MTKLRWVAELFQKNPTPFTFLIFVVFVLVFVLTSARIPEKSQSLVVWALVLLLIPPTVLVVIALSRRSSVSLTARDRLLVNKHILLETGKVPPCANHYIGQPIRVAQASLLDLYKRLLA